MMFWLALPLTLALYFMTRALYRRLPWPVINPVLIPTAVIIGLLLWLDLPLDQVSGVWLASGMRQRGGVFCRAEAVWQAMQG